uniref:protein-histidine N-methyltransferase n=1 Tax=Trichogramma kaykai TaxID=54128 RepID=A0ABD2X794_9HYME
MPDKITKLKKQKFRMDIMFEFYLKRWAVSTVMTRQNMIPVKNEDKMILSLIPFWDMCNHEEGRITTNFDLSTNSCECFAMRHFKKSDQIFIHYGSRTNTEFFIHSGFLPENNHNDSFRLRLGISHLDPLKEQRIYLLNKLGLPINHEYTLRPGNEVISGRLLAFLRIFHFSKSELIKWMNSENFCMLTESSCDISNDIHCKAISYIKVRLELLMQRYKNHLILVRPHLWCHDASLADDLVSAAVDKVVEGSDQKPLLPDGQTLMPKTAAQRERRRVQQQRSRARKREAKLQQDQQIDPRPPLRVTARKILDLPLPPWTFQRHVSLSMPSLEYDIEEPRPSVRSVVVVPTTNHHLYYDPEHPEF